MISRYSRPEMERVWLGSSRFEYLLKVELAVAKVEGQMGIIPMEAALDIEKKAKVNVDEILRIEEITRHDIIAFVTQIAETVGENGRYIHFGLTSSDVLDTALSLQIRDAGEILDDSIGKWQAALEGLVRAHKSDVCAGRTHGMHAEPTTFGLKMAGYLAELKRSRTRLRRSIEEAARCKISGAVGTYSSLPPEVEMGVAKELDLKVELASTQVIPRDRIAEVMTSLAIFGGALERLSIELRHLQRTELSEAREGFASGQKGSSAMPHKRNPIGSENLTGAARMLRGFAVAALENIALWHERDISHSSVERVFLPDAFILADYAADRMGKILRSLEVDVERMKVNMDLSQGQLMSSQLLLVLVEAGQSREEAYKMVQRISHYLKPGEHLLEAALNDEKIMQILKPAQVKKVFSSLGQSTVIESVIGKVLSHPDGGLS